MQGADVIAAAMRLRAVRAAGKFAWSGHSLLPTTDAVRVSSARQVAGLYADSGHHQDAAEVLQVAAERTQGSAQTELLAARVQAQLDGGVTPADLEDVLCATLAEADAGLARSDMPHTVDRLTDALAIAFHPTRHLLVDPSPLLTSPESFLAPLNRSTAIKALAQPRHDVDPRPRKQEASRVLVLTLDDSDMVQPLLAHYATPDVAESGRQVRYRELASVPQVANKTDLRSIVAARLRYSLSGLRVPVPRELQADLDWADVVFVEWGHRVLAWASLLDTRVPIVGRVRKYEAMTPMPMLTAWEEVGRTIFVADTIRQVVEATAPAVRTTQSVIIPERVDLPELRRDKRPEAARTLALIGWNKVSKDPQWAFDVVERLREKDPTWRLLLIGETEPADRGADGYYEDLTRRILKFKDAVEVTGFTEDLSHTLTRVGVIFSSSRLEGQHDSLVQGVASGALPVVRDWPDLVRWGGAGSVYPKDWVVGSVEEAAKRILEALPTPSASSAARTARNWVARNYNPDRLQNTFDAVVFGSDRNRRLRRRR
ncbi:MAG TPA: glycosyltransferase [Beutenbergiaceae bacterium]|nr:glycosyltransferase [Beutenbergiaceae bacterium]